MHDNIIGRCPRCGGSLTNPHSCGVLYEDDNSKSKKCISCGIKSNFHYCEKCAKDLQKKVKKVIESRKGI